MTKLNGLYKVQTSDQMASKHRVTSTMNFCRKLGLQDTDFKALNIIHITGTKGKGSTCAFVESLLRNSGYRTGHCSSPHLIELTERFKINGEPISFRKFTEYAEHCYSLLIGGNGGEEPTLFQFLTCMMFYVFSQEKVQVAIVEVGIGGEFDVTNCIP